MLGICSKAAATLRLKRRFRHYAESGSGSWALRRVWLWLMRPNVVGRLGSQFTLGGTTMRCDNGKVYFVHHAMQHCWCQSMRCNNSSAGRPDLQTLRFRILVWVDEIILQRTWSGTPVSEFRSHHSFVLFDIFKLFYYCCCFILITN